MPKRESDLMHFVIQDFKEHSFCLFGNLQMLEIMEFVSQKS